MDFKKRLLMSLLIIVEFINKVELLDEMQRTLSRVFAGFCLDTTKGRLPRARHLRIGDRLRAHHGILTRALSFGRGILLVKVVSLLA